MLLRFFRTESFWLPAIFGIALALIIGLLGLVALSITERTFEGFIRQRSENTLARLKTYYYQRHEAGSSNPGGLEGAARYLIGHQASTGSTTHNLLQVGGKRIAGNLPPMAPLIGLHEVRNPLRPQVHVLGIGAQLDPGVYVFVGTDMTYFDQAYRQMLYVLLWVLGGILILAPVGGYLISRRFLNRIDAISGTCHAIMTGNLNDRIPVRTSHNELDRLSEVVNAMLSRISNLVITLRQVSSDVAHDLRTPMVHLRMGIEKALVNAKTPEELRAELQSALVASDEILQMFEAVLRLSEIEGGKRLESFPVLNLKELVGKVVEFYRPAIEDGGRKLQLGELQPCAVNGDRGLLFQMLSNLLENSIIHTPKGTVITLALQSGRGHASIVLGDNGGGIPPSEREKVFQRFYRRDVSRNSPGHGLGLSLVAAIADAHGGTVAINDPADGAPGVEFVIALPLLPAAASITAVQGRETSDGWGRASAQPAE
jgi:signal transduction histidine kinase